MKISKKQLENIIKEEMQILESEQKFDPSVSNEQFNHIRDLLSYDFNTGLMFLQSGLGFENVPEEQRKELAKIIWDASVGYREDPEYVREIERKKISTLYRNHKSVEFHKKKLAAMDREFEDNIEAVGDLMGLENPYSDMIAIAYRGRLAFDYFYDQLKQKGIL